MLFPVISDIHYILLLLERILAQFLLLPFAETFSPVPSNLIVVVGALVIVECVDAVNLLTKILSRQQTSHIS